MNYKINQVKTKILLTLKYKPLNEYSRYLDIDIIQCYKKIHIRKYNPNQVK